jgi:hypothetical protein
VAAQVVASRAVLSSTELLNRISEKVKIEKQQKEGNDENKYGKK